MATKVKAAIIGSGNIGTDLLYKALRSEIVEPVWMVGIDPESEGLKRAKELGLKTTHEGVKGLEPHIVEDKIRIAWDATSAYVHRSNNDLIKRYGVKMVDLTPAAIGPFCVPRGVFGRLVLKPSVFETYSPALSVRFAVRRAESVTTRRFAPRSARRAGS